MTLDQLSTVCNAVGIDVYSLFESAKGISQPICTFTIAQEEFFSANPHYSAFFEEHFRSGKTIDQIRMEHRISLGSIQRYLKKLEKTGLFRKDSKSGWKISLRGTLKWDDHGPMG